MDELESHRSRDLSAAREVRFADVFSPDRIQIGIKVSSAKRMLEVVSGLLANNSDDAVDEDVVFRTLLEREHLGSTCVGNGVALPHGRLDNIQTPIGAIMCMETPLKMDAIDDKPVDLVCALVVPANARDEHIELLRKLAEGIERYSLDHRIRNAASCSEVYLELAKLDGPAPI